MASQGNCYLCGKELGSFPVGAQLLHEYDFGDTTETKITIVASTRRKAQKKAARLLARNVPPVFACSQCGKPADAICAE